MMKIFQLKPELNGFSVTGKVTRLSSLDRKLTSSQTVYHVFSFVLIDDKNEIKVTSFQQQLFQIMSNDKIISISGGIIKENNKYNWTNNKYQLTLQDKSKVSVVENSTMKYPNFHSSIVSLSTINNCSTDSYIDVVGEIVGVSGIADINQLKQKREFIIQEGPLCITCTLWNERLNDIDDSSLNKNVLLKSVSVSTYKGRSLNISQATVISFDQDLDTSLNNTQSSTQEEIKSLSTDTVVFTKSSLDSVTNLHLTDRSPKYFEVACNIRCINASSFNRCPKKECGSTIVNIHAALEIECPKCCSIVAPTTTSYYKVLLKKGTSIANAVCFNTVDCEFLSKLPSDQNQVDYIIHLKVAPKKGNLSFVIMQIINNQEPVEVTVEKPHLEDSFLLNQKPDTEEKNESSVDLSPLVQPPLSDETLEHQNTNNKDKMKHGLSMYSVSQTNANKKRVEDGEEEEDKLADV